MQINVGLLGLGNIGSGVNTVIANRQADLAVRENVNICVKRILVRDLQKQRRTAIDTRLLTTDPMDILADPNIDLVAEFMGGIEPARTYLLTALSSGKSVVTANKELISSCWEELDLAARRNGAGLYYGASVAGGIPIIGTLNRSLQANRIVEILGIVNGTTNAILTDMSDKAMTYDEALADAQAKGFAEPDPSMDVSGQDAAHKLSILASLAFGQRVHKEDITCCGITEITPEDIAFGKDLGLVLKLLAIGRVEGGTLQVRVQPTFVPISHPIASVRGAYNAVFLEGDAVGQIMLYGRGAGDMPTASAIVSDIVMAARNKGQHEHPAFLSKPVTESAMLLENNWTSAYYIHLRVADTPGALAAIAGAMAHHGVSLVSVHQTVVGTQSVPIILVTHPAQALSVQASIEEINDLDVVDRVVNCIPVESES